ncbi:MAG: methyltransferase family protein [Candidatus Limnocylindrales bacterium]
MDVTLELAARAVTIGACLGQLAAGVAVLIRERLVPRPAPMERETGLLGLVNYVGIGSFIVIGLGVAVSGVGALLGLAEPLGAALRVIGMAVLAGAGIVATWAVRTMGKHLVAPAEVRPDTELVTTGPFGVVRHPLYLSVLMLWAGGTLALLSPVLAIGLVLVVPAFYLRARAEERMLTRHFGAGYTAYATRVPMLRPRIGGRTGS